MIKIIYFILILLVSCAEEKSLNETFTKTAKLTGEPYDFELITYPPSDLFLIDNELQAVQSDHRHLLQKINTKTGESNGFWGSLGNGPGEYISPRFGGFSPDKTTFMFYDFNTQKMREYYTSDYSLAKEVKMKQKGGFYFTSIRQVDNNYYVGNIIFGEGKPLRLLDKQFNVISEFGDLRGVKGENYPLDGNARIDTYNGSFVYAMCDMGYLAFYKLKDGNPQLQWDWYAEEPIYRTPGSLDRKELLEGFSEIKITKEFIFCVYKGQKYDPSKNDSPKTILVFDHKGKAIKKLEFDLDFRFARFEVTQDQKTIYIISHETELFRFDISNIL